MAQAVMFVLALKSWHLRGQVTHSRLHAHEKGTTASTHKQGDTVQLCYQVAGQTAQNIVYDLLVNYAFVDLVLLINPHGMLNKSAIYQDFIIH